MLKHAGMVERTSGTDDLSLEMQKGESARIRAIRMFFTAAGAEDFTVKIDRKSIQQFVAPSGWYLLGENAPGGQLSLYRELLAAGVLRDIPLASGQTLTLTAPGAGDYVEVAYDLYDEGDVRATEPNGSESNEYDLIQVVSNVAEEAAGGDIPLDQSDLASEFIGFPGGEVVPVRVTLDLVGLFGNAITAGDATNNAQYSTLIKGMHDRVDIFDKDLGGFTLVGDADHVADSVVYLTVAGALWAGVQYMRPGVVILDNPMRFESGEELNVTMTTVAGVGTKTVAAAFAKLGMVFHVIQSG